MKKSWMHNRRWAVVAPILLAVSLSTVAFGESRLQDSFDPKSISAWAAMPDEQRAAVTAPLDHWRQKALLSLSKKDQSPASGPDDFRLIAEGSRLQVPGRDFSRELLRELGDTRLVAAMEFSAGKRGAEGLSGQKALLQVCEEILTRPSLSAHHARASFEKAVVPIFWSEDPQQVIADLRETSAKFKGQPFASKADHAAAALTDPEEPEDFAEAIQIMEWGTQQRLRLPQRFVTTAVLRKYKAIGPQELERRALAGEAEPLKAVTRAAFEIMDRETLQILDGMVQRSSTLDIDLAAEVRYYYAMSEVYQHEYATAASIFDEIINSGAAGYFACCSSLRLAHCFRWQRDYLKAGVAYMDTQVLSAGRFPEVEEMATRELNSIINYQLVPLKDVQAAHVAKIQNGELSSAVNYQEGQK